ncbi:hypothetical protein ACLB2K_047880 [Fragaria x ananassa]
MYFEKRSFESEVWLTSDPNRWEGEDSVEIKIKIYTKMGVSLKPGKTMSDGIPYHHKGDELVISDLPRSELLSNRGEYTWRMVDFFSRQFKEEPLPDHVRRSCIEEVFRVAEKEDPAVASTASVIHVDIVEVKECLFTSACDAFLDDAISSVEGMEKERVDGCFLGFEDSCVICMEDLVDKKGKKQFKQQPKRKSKRLLGLQSSRGTIAKTPRKEPPPLRVVARLPCSHRFHGGCIVNWLKNNHVCPLCRNQVVGQPSLTKLFQEVNCNNWSLCEPRPTLPGFSSRNQ